MVDSVSAAFSGALGIFTCIYMMYIGSTLAAAASDDDDDDEEND